MSETLPQVDDDDDNYGDGDDDDGHRRIGEERMLVVK